MDVLSADLLDWLVEEDDKQHSEDLPIHTRPFAVPKTDKEIEDVISAGVSKKTRVTQSTALKYGINGQVTDSERAFHLNITL